MAAPRGRTEMTSAEPAWWRRKALEGAGVGKEGVGARGSCPAEEKRREGGEGKRASAWREPCRERLAAQSSITGPSTPSLHQPRHLVQH